MNRSIYLCFLFACFVPTSFPDNQQAMLFKHIPVRFKETAQVFTKDYATVSSRIMATILNYQTAPGDEVSKGDLLVNLDDTKLRLQKDQALQSVEALRAGIRSYEQQRIGLLARVKEVEAQFNRVSSYFKQGASTKQELEQATSQFQQARSQLDSIDEQLSSNQSKLSGAQKALEEVEVAISYSKVRAPFDGKVSQTFLKEGDLATPGKPLLAIFNPEHYQAVCKLPESLSQVARLGVGVKILVQGQSYESQISELSPSLESSSRTFPIKANFKPENKIYPGSYAQLELVTGQRKVLLVHRDYLHKIGQLDYVMKKSGQSDVDQWLRQYVRLGEAIDSDYIEIRTGLSGTEVLRKKK